MHMSAHVRTYVHQARLAVLQRGDESTWARVTAPGTPYVVGLTVCMYTARAPARRLQPLALEAATLHIRGRNPATL
jgi:hypothetical protein